MPYRFVLEVPEALQEEAKVVVDSSRGARVVVERHPRAMVTVPDDAIAALTIACQNLDIIDELHRWLNEYDGGAGVVIDAYNGGRVTFADHDPKALRRLVRGDQYWFENTVPRIRYVEAAMMEGGARVSEVPYGGRLASRAIAVPADNPVALGSVDAVAVRVRDIAKAEAYYRDFFGMGVAYRARRDGDRWQVLEDTYDYDQGLHTGTTPEVVRMENPPVALVLINAGMGAVMHENRVAYVSVNVPPETLTGLRGRALFANYTIQEDSPHAFRFVDPFGVTWQLVVND